MLIYHETRGSIRLDIKSNDNPENPRNEEYNLGKMICFHNRHFFGDKHDHATPDDFIHRLLTKHFGGNEDRADKYKRECESYGADSESILHESNVILPVYLYDHSGQSVSTTPFTGHATHSVWDSGQIGWIYADKETVIRTFGAWNDVTIAKTEAALVEEVKTYDDYLSGETYIYSFYDELAGETINSGTWIGDLESLKKETLGMLPPEDSEEELQQLNEQLAELLLAEYDAFLLEMKELPAQEIIDHAYQIAAKGDLAYAGEAIELSKREYEALLSSSNVLDSLYSEWMHMDINQNEEVLDCAHYAAKNEYLYGRRQNKGGDAR